MKRTVLLLAVGGFSAFTAHAGEITAKQNEVMTQLLATYAQKAGEDARKLRGKDAPTPAFSAETGREFYLKRRTWQLNDFTCSGCHTEDPRKEGKHIETKKPIKPLAPVANPERFTDVAKVEKNFAQHCFDLHDRDCRPHEKGNFIAYLMSVK